MSLRPPKACASMIELRKEIDALDQDLISLLVTRAGYIDRAVELKQQEGLPARINDRVAEVIANVRGHAADQELDPDLAQTVWSALIEWSIQREDRVLSAP